MKTASLQRFFIRLLPVAGFLILIPLPAVPQESGSRKLTLNGYVSSLQTVMAFDSVAGTWLLENQLHNRLNLSIYPTSHLQAAIQARTRFTAGDRFTADPGQTQVRAYAKDPGWIDLAFNWAHGSSYVLNTAIDRLWVQYSGGNTEITLGRQRLNWGQTFVWNPNDWFNNFSFFDVDYVERPGSDALSIRHFSGPVAGQEWVLSADSAGHITTAARVRFNFKGYDFQVLGGWIREEDLAVGAGWSGHIRQAGFRGEVSYLHPSAHPSDTSGIWLASVNLDYTFPNSLYVSAEVFYDQAAARNRFGSFAEFTGRPLSVKDLSFTEWNAMFQASGPVTPLLTASMALVYYPGLKGVYLAPSLDYSLGDNLTCSLWVQHFSGAFPDQGRQQLTLGLLRFKYSF